jgi:predicted permease
MNFFFTKNQFNNEIIIAYSIKIIVILLVGYLEGKLEWNFYQKIFGPSVNTLSKLRKRYVINKGVLTFGLPLGIINFRFLKGSFMFEYVRLSIWLIIGVFFGAILWRKNKQRFKQIIND